MQGAARMGGSRAEKGGGGRFFFRGGENEVTRKQDGIA